MTDFSERYKKAREMVLNSRIKNPKTGNMVKVSTALKRGHPAYDAARAMVKQHMASYDSEQDRLDTGEKRSKEMAKKSLDTTIDLANAGKQVIYKNRFKKIGPATTRIHAEPYRSDRLFKQLKEIDPEKHPNVKSVKVSVLPNTKPGKNYVDKLGFDVEYHAPAFWKEDDFPRLSNIADRQMDLIRQEFAQKAGIDDDPSSKDMMWRELKKKDPGLHKKWIKQMRDLADKEANYLEGEITITDNPYYKEYIKKFRELVDYFDNQLDPKIDMPDRIPRPVQKPLGPRGGTRWTFDDSEPEPEPQKKSLFKRFFGM